LCLVLIDELNSFCSNIDKKRQKFVPNQRSSKKTRLSKLLIAP